MKIHQNKIYYITLRAADGSDLVTNQPVKFADEPSFFIISNGMGFKKIWQSEFSVTYCLVSCSDLSSIAVTDHE